MSNTKYYKISETDLLSLLVAANQFWALDQGGVDNWTWCGESCNDYLDRCNEELNTDFEDFEALAEYEVTTYQRIE